MYDKLFSEQSDSSGITKQTTYNTRKWSLGNHGTKTNVDTGSIISELGAKESMLSQNARDLLDAARRVQDDDAGINDFECPHEDCHLGHGHDDKKHDIRSGFNVTEEFAEAMEMCPYCHCGVNELAILIDFYHDIRMQMFADEDELTPAERDERFSAIESAAESAKLPDHTRRYVDGLREEAREARDAAYSDDQTSGDDKFTI